MEKVKLEVTEEWEYEMERNEDKSEKLETFDGKEN